MNVTALGMIETIGLVSAIEAADAGLKAADVRLLGTDYVRGGLVMVRFEGEVAAVQAAVDAGACAAKRVGTVFSAHVIPRAMPEVFCMLASDVNEGPAKLRAGGCSQCGGCEGGRRECEALRKIEAERAGERAANGDGSANGNGNGSANDSGSANGGTASGGENSLAIAIDAPDDTNPGGVNARRGGENDITSDSPNASHTPNTLDAPEAPGDSIDSESPNTSDAPEALSADPERLAGMRVVELRKLARKLPGFGLTANEIRYATRSMLLEAISAWRAKGE